MIAIVAVITCYPRPTNLPTRCCSVSLTVFSHCCSLTPSRKTLNCSCIILVSVAPITCHHCCTDAESHIHIAIIVAVTVAQFCCGLVVRTLKHACLTAVLLCASSDLVAEQVSVGNAFGNLVLFSSLLFMLNP